MIFVLFLSCDYIGMFFINLVRDMLQRNQFDLLTLICKLEFCKFQIDCKCSWMKYEKDFSKLSLISFIDISLCYLHHHQLPLQQSLLQKSPPPLLLL